MNNREEITTTSTETRWQVVEEDMETGKRRQWDIRQRTIDYKYQSPEGGRQILPSGEIAAIPEIGEVRPAIHAPANDFQQNLPRNQEYYRRLREQSRKALPQGEENGSEIDIAIPWNRQRT